MAELPRPARRSRPVLSFVGYLRPVRGVLAASLVASLAQAVLQWVAPWPLKVVFDSVLAHDPLPGFFAWLPTSAGARLALLTAFSLAVAGAIALTDFAAERWVAQAGQRVVAAIRIDLFDHLQRQGLAFHQAHRTGDLMSRLDGDAQDIQDLTVEVLPLLANNAIVLLAFSITMIALDPVLGVVSLSMAPTMFVLVRHYMTRIKRAQRKALNAQGDSAGVAQETLTGITTVQTYGAERHELARFSEANGRQLDANLRAVVLEARFSPLVALTMAATTTLVVYVGARAVLATTLTPGDLLVFLAYLRGMYSPVRQLAKMAGVAGRGHAAAERVREVLDTDQAVPEPARPRRLRRASGALELVDVWFSYPGHEDALRAIDLEVAAGTRLAVVGRTGSGKSTILKLVPRLLDPTSGRVLLDGTDIREFALPDLRRQITVVSQEPHLFRGAAWENIVYTLPGASRSAAVEAARRAGVDEILGNLPGGYDAHVAERGTSLSGGQRQCIALARAMARDTPILLLDEPTTGLDIETETVLLSALDRVSAGRTTVMVTHQLPAARSADSIAVIEDGCLVEVGDHRHLSLSGRTYARLDAITTARATSSVGAAPA